MEKEKLKTVVKDILSRTPNSPFLCLQFSAFLYRCLTKEHQEECSLVTGNLSFKDIIIFEHDSNISGMNNSSLEYWGGHAWVNMDGIIIDLSFFRTLYSDDFKKPCKSDLIDLFGKDRGCIIGSKKDMSECNLFYVPVECLTDQDATNIIEGVSYLTNPYNIPLLG